MPILILAILLFYFSSPVPVFAQVNATVGGTVSDSTGALIPGVEVTATNVNTGIATNRLTNETGAYEFPSLQPGSYTVSAVLSGFQTQTFNNVQLSQGQQVRLNFTLQVGTVATAGKLSKKRTRFSPPRRLRWVMCFLTVKC